MSALGPRDIRVLRLLKEEGRRQNDVINLIASENYASREVLKAQGSLLTNKYAEGYPRHRFYGGCSVADEIESLAIERAKKLFHAEHANVQSHAGAQANVAAYLAFLKPGDSVLGMSLAHGGHLTHGASANFSSKIYQFSHYGLNRESELLDYDEIEKLALKVKPKLIVAGASAYPRLIDFKRFRRIADRCGAFLMVDMAHIAGLVAGGVHPNPVAYSDVTTSTTHKTLRGPRSGFILSREQYAKAVDSAVFPGSQGGPLMHAIAAKAICFYEALDPAFKDYQLQVVKNARVLAEELNKRGFRLVSGGTDNHMVLIDLSSTGHTGKDAQEILELACIQTNKNVIPFESRPPHLGSGLRLGTPAVTTRGFREAEIRKAARWIAELLSNPTETRVSRVKEEANELCRKFPIPGL